MTGRPSVVEVNREALALSLWDEGVVRPESLAREAVDHILDHPLAAAGLLASSPTPAGPTRESEAEHAAMCDREEAHERQARAEAWDEGFTRGFYAAQALPRGADASESTVDNPYTPTS